MAPSSRSKTPVGCLATKFDVLRTVWLTVMAVALVTVVVWLMWDHTSENPVRKDFGRRDLTVKEQKRCAGEMEVLEHLGVKYAAAATVGGFSLAVYSGDDGQGDSASSWLLSKGVWNERTSNITYDFAQYLMKAAPSTWTKCRHPPCHRHAAIDVGSNLGWWAFVGAKKKWKMIAVEASPNNHALIRLSMCLNPKLAPYIELRSTLIGNDDSTCIVASDKRDFGDARTFCKLKGQKVEWTDEEVREFKLEHRKAITHDRDLDFASITRSKVMALDDLLDDAYEQDPRIPRHIALLRMHAHNLEYLAFQGGRRWLQKLRILTIYGEVNHAIYGGGVDCLEYLSGLGYVIVPDSCSNTEPLRPNTADFQNFVGSGERMRMFCAFLPDGYLKTEPYLESKGAPWTTWVLLAMGVTSALLFIVYRRRQCVEVVTEVVDNVVPS
eukprot:TRINITY_DN4966_c0_g1_i2.p1 TRINITY_DN4966_c0_g1~~TRINITY_DN4966_c0_g1_i2.p1  ORF type:complete len:439 (+),score=123.02 TRINITY_DN4966_c0_g1_i2:72-1388(+)